ncbi:terminase large subunit [Rufibacter roseus]|uniref:terminase large subunit n=1 Tax=Rufibacter roseus TaxID=1567108 RepID=UPI00129053C1|nr:terminase large subunit [Rufibacter roseus]
MQESPPRVSPAQAAAELLARRQARTNMQAFVLYTKPDYVVKPFNHELCKKLDAFARGEIKKLIVTMPPQHGKSELTTRRFPAYLLGRNPKLKIAICSYSATVAEKFNRDIQRIIDNDSYHKIFPDTVLNESNVVSSAQGSFLRNSEIFETVGHGGFVKTVGVGGSLTSTPVDIGIIDDPLKDRKEAKSITVRESVWDWYTDVFETRLHNDSQQLIIMTRWDPSDLVGKVLKRDKDWQIVNFEGIKTGPKTDYDQREVGEALFPEKHSLERLLAIKESNPITFNSLYQQDPKPSLEALVYPNWRQIQAMPDLQPTYGMDFGFTNDPSTLVEVMKQNLKIFTKEVFYEKGLTNNAIKKRTLNYFLSTGRNLKSLIVGDSAEPKTIADLQAETICRVEPNDKRDFPNLTAYIFKTHEGEFYKLAGLNIVGAHKPPGSINAGVEYLNEHEVYVEVNSANLWQERNSYEYIMMNGVSTNEIYDRNNHALDPIRYVVNTVYSNNKPNNNW